MDISEKWSCPHCSHTVSRTHQPVQDWSGYVRQQQSGHRCSRS